MTLVSVYKKKGEEISSLLKRFKRRVENSGHLIELMERRFYSKPSVIKRKQKLDMIFKDKKKRERLP